MANKHKRIGAVSLPAIKETVGGTLCVQFKSGVKDTPELDKAGNPKTDDEGNPRSTKTAVAVNMDTGEMGTFVFRAAHDEIVKHCGGPDAIDGRAFEITKHDKVEGKKYFTYEIHEIEAK